MKRTLIIITLLLFAITLPIACDEDSNTTKLDICRDLVEGFCNKSDSLDCDVSECRSEGNADCEQLFDGTCIATDGQIWMVREEMIPGWIDSKESCNGLYSIEDDLQREMAGIKTAACANDSSSTDGDDAVDGDSTVDGDTTADGDDGVDPGLAACAEQYCPSETEACTDPCQNMLDCLNACGDETCESNCAVTYPDGVQPLTLLLSCMGTNCAEYLY